MGEVVIQVDKLSKMYRIGRRVKYKALRDVLTEAVGAPVRKLRSFFSGSLNGSSGREDDHIWALADVSFEVKHGDVIGVIGRNGAGKSTLLKILSRITTPTTGYAEIHGRVGSLLEVGTGFHPELTGRENVFLSAAILGMKKREIIRLFDEIVAFAEVEKFIDTPVKHYSTGMSVRLAFAVAAHLEPEILLVDEVLAVGDMAFQKKCLGKMGEVSRAGRTVLFVSHNMQAVRALCQRCLLLSDGRVAAIDTAPEAISLYYAQTQSNSVTINSAVHDPTHRRGSGAVRFSDIRVENGSGISCAEFRSKEDIRFHLSYEVLLPVPELLVSIAIRSGKSGEFVTSVTHAVSRSELDSGAAGQVILECPQINLRPGEYPLYFWLGNSLFQPYDVVDDLIAPLIIYADSTNVSLDFNPANPLGYFDMKSRLIRA